MITFFKSKRQFLHRWVLCKAKLNMCSPFSNQKDSFCIDECVSKQSWTRAYLFHTKKTLFAQIFESQKCSMKNSLTQMCQTGPSDRRQLTLFSPVATSRKYFSNRTQQKYFNNNRKIMPKTCEVPPLYGPRSAWNSPVMYFQTFLPKFLGFAQKGWKTCSTFTFSALSWLDSNANQKLTARFPKWR